MASTQPKYQKKIINASNSPQKEEETGETLLGFIYEQTNRFYISHIPIDFIRDLPDTCELSYFIIT
jgi:hypothetical protein